MSQHAFDQAADMPGGVRATVEDAAKLLGLSENAIRKRIERGTLRSEKIDGVRYVVLDADMSQHAADMPNGMPADIPLIVERLEDEVAFLRSELERKDHLLAAALERIPSALEPPRDAPESTAANDDRGKEREEEGSPRSPWWRRLF